MDHQWLEKKREFLDGIKRARVEVDEAVLDLNKSNWLSFCQVWFIRYGKKECAVKLGGYYIDAFKDYYGACFNIEDGSGGLAVKALETYQPYWSRNINNIIIKGELHALLPATSASEYSYCCLAICMKNIYTGNLDYVFEFIFSVYDVSFNPSVFLDSLFKKLKSCLPSFKLSSGSQLSDQSLLVVDVDTLIAFETHEKEKEVCMMDHQLPRSIKVKIVDVATDTKDKDKIIECEFFDFRQAFLSLCQRNHYQYDTLRRSKHSSIMAFVSICIVCRDDIETGQGWHCDICHDYDVCNVCYQKVDHPHQLIKHTSIDERDAQTKEARQQVRILLNLLGHACQCQAGQCHYRGCGNVKELLQHGMLCKVYPFVDCPLCKYKWHLLQLHSRYCRDTPCNVPCCRDLRERLTKLTRQADSQRMAAIIDEMRQRNAEVAGSSG
ncbi:histone acetyltransferase HAC1-like [Rutidosis leptorrhynchoides]|uniref:histone acetyltransferase HAC1-like n=1 Tax=Rutidosis leptorrhynchoides TaxID=125765 RepID=UPI003A99C619